MRISRLLFLTLMVAVLLSGTVWAGGWQTSGVGARALAMGSAYRAIANDGIGAYYNPAGLAFLQENSFNLTAQFLGPRPEVTPNFESNGYSFGYLDGQKRYPEDLVYLQGETSLFFRLRKADKVVLGVAFFQAYDENTDMNLFQLSPAYNDIVQVPSRNHHSNLDVVTWQPTVAIKLSQDRLGLGAGLQIHRGDIFVDQIRLVDNPYPYPLDVRPYDKFPELVSVDGFGYGVGFNLGVQYKATPKVTLGASYTSSSKFTLSGDSKERFYLPHNAGVVNMYRDPLTTDYEKEVDSTYKGAMIGCTGEFEVEMKLPSEFGVGVAYRPSDRTILAADLAYTMWSDFEAFNILFKERTFFQTSPGYYDTWIKMFTDVTIPFDWDNTVKLSLGIERILNERWTLRGGYMFDQSPIPDETMTGLFLDTGAKHHFNGGLGFKLNDKISFDGALELVLCSSRDVTALADINNDGYWDNLGGKYKNMGLNSTWALNYRF